MTAFFSTGASSASRAQLDALKALFNTGTLKIYNGTQHDPDVASITDTLLATFTFAATAFGADATAGSFSTKTETATATFSASTVVAAATGTASWFGLFNSGGTLLATGTVGTSGADINFNSVAFSSGANVTLSSFTLTQPQ